MKKAITIIMLLACSLFVYADKYLVNARSGLNIRNSPNTNSQIIGKLEYQSIIDVEAINGDWAEFQMNGEDAYVNIKYISPTSASTQDTGKKESWSFWKWLFHHDKFTIFTLIKWILIISIGYIIVRFALMIAITILSGGLAIGGMALGACFLLKLLGIMETDTMWTVSKWAFNAGLVFGVGYAVTHLGDLLNEALDSNTSSSSGGGGSSSGGGSDWESEHGDVYNDANGNSYIVDGKNKTHWINHSSNGHATDNNGNEWLVTGNNARKINR